MKRVLIIGCAGTGKSTFAKKLFMRTGLPIVHLDKVYWKPGWVESNKADFIFEVSQLITPDCWIMDGNYKSTLALRLARADSVIFLDLNRIKCLWNVFSRTVHSYGKVRNDMPQGCPERFDWQFAKYIWKFPQDYRPVLVELLKTFDGDIFQLRSFAEYDAYFQRLAD